MANDTTQAPRALATRAYNRLVRPEHIRLGILFLGKQSIGQARRFGFFSVVHRVDSNTCALLERLEDRLGEHAVGRYIHRDGLRRGRIVCAGSPTCRHGDERETAKQQSHRATTVKSSKYVTESAFVQTPTLPAPVNVVSSTS